MKKLILILSLLLVFPCNVLTFVNAQETYQSETKTFNWLNILDFGAIGDGRQENAEVNTNAIKQCIELVNNNTNYSTIYIPAGLYIINPIDSADGVDFRYCNFQGDGVRKTVLKLANNINKPMFRTPLWFESSIRDIQFNGNKNNNPDAECTVKFIGNNVYTMSLDNLYFRDHANIGLLIDGGQLYNLNNIQAKFGGDNSHGIYIKNSFSVTINHPDCEQNGKTGITIESTNLTGYRRYNPLIYIRNPYLEQNPIGINLKGICRVSIEAGYNSQGMFAKIENSGDAYAHFNNIIGQPQGVTLVTKGNYGNYFSNVNGGQGGMIDEDGRNNNRLYNWDYTSRNFYGLPEFKDISTNPADYTNKNEKNGTEILSIENEGYLGKYSCLNDLTEIGVVQFKSTASNISNSIFYYPRQNWDANTTYYYYFLADMDANAVGRIRVYDMTNRVYLNWHTGLFEEGSDDYKTNAIIPSFGGGIQGYQIPIAVDDAIDRKLRIQLDIRSTDMVESTSKVYYVMVSKTKDLGLLHYRNGIKIAEGL